MRRPSLRSTLAGAIMLGAVGAAGTGVAQAGPLTGSPLNEAFTVNIWNYQCYSCTIGDASQQALPGANTAGNAILSSQVATNATYTGPLNFGLGSGGTDTIGAFFKTGGGTSTPDLTALTNTLSTGSYNGNTAQTTTLMEFTFQIGNSLNVIAHDDGVSLFNHGVTTPASDLLALAASAPTSLTDTSVTLKPGTYDLWYVEANGLPAHLTLDTTPVPEPGSLALLGTGLLGLGLILSRRRKS